MTETQNRPGDVITEAAREAQVSAGAADNDTALDAILTPVKTMTFAELLQALGHGDPTDLHHDKVAISWKRPGDTFTSELHDVEDVARVVQMFTPADGLIHFWFGVNPVSREVAKGRGTAKDVTRLAALYADLDVKPGGCPDLDTAHLLIDDVSDVLHMRPVAIIHSGHGLQPIWAVEPSSAASLRYPGDAAKLLQRFRHAVEFVAECHDCTVDPVFDLPRILRVPDTLNVKDVEHPVPTWCEADTGKPLTVEQIVTALDEFGAPEERPKFGNSGNGQAPQQFSRRALINRVAKAPEGQRNRTLYGAARDAARQGDLDTDMADKLTDAALTAGLEAGEIDSTIYSAACAEEVDIMESATGATRSDAAQDDAEFWAQREVLARVLEFSRARGVAPYAVLGGVLRRAITYVLPSVQLPPTVGDAVSVNLFTVAVGRSGQGKDAANGVARSAVEFVTADGETRPDPPSAIGIGSGEGLAKALRGTGDDESIPALINLEVPEIGTLGALAQRKGGTVIGELLKAYMGQPLGFTNASSATTSFVPAHSYRLCFGVGAQPENADVFLDREKDGLPQRFLWLPTVDPHAPAPSDAPGEPVTAARVVLPTFPIIIAGTPYLVGVPASVQHAIRMHRHRVNIGDMTVDPLDGHLMLTRLKVSFGLALLDGRRDIADDDWRVAGQLIEVSNRVRADLKAVMAEQRNRSNQAKAHAQADRQQIIDERVTGDRQRRVAEAIVRKLQREGQATKRDLRKAVTTSIRDEFDAVFDEMIEDGIVRSGDGERYELASQ